MHLTWLDSNSWLIEMGGKRVLLDPWLVGPLVFGNMNWLFKGERRSPRLIPDSIDLILLSQGLEDHAHPATLERLDRQIPVVASPSAAKVVQGLGYTQVTTLAHGKTTAVENLEIRATPGSPIGPLLTENGYLLKDLTAGTKLYYEPHGYHSPSIKEFAPVDVVITPVVTLEIPLLGPVIQGKKTVLEVVQWLQPKVLLPTAAGGDVQFEGILQSLLRAGGSIEELRSLLAQHQLSTQVVDLQPGERYEPLAIAV
ncbi:MBL fold metallo-hydrolase [Leptolyngbya sp. FACHB-671]|uniref:MBL fold metallo-hydrolase n=1 Tax=Leptolyngbya sp. FACHB-671 TaxID=2692812 RepID=UPI001685A7D8|nr:MBL fold metallo-hydrolase [Leptolyngbya sp. FACHB-671]MBD2068500.1 MBL fold metallo-hydrolase [Leptolyngbya sp. FACHB-671]